MLTPSLQTLISWAFLLVSKLLRTLHHLHPHNLVLVVLPEPSAVCDLCLELALDVLLLLPVAF